MTTEPKRIVLAYSGGLDTSVIMRWLQETYGCPVVAFVADLGQDEDLDAIARKAERTGAEQVFVEDVQEAFVRDFVFPALRAHAVYEGTYLLGTSLARPPSRAMPDPARFARVEVVIALPLSGTPVQRRWAAATGAGTRCPGTPCSGPPR